MKLNVGCGDLPAPKPWINIDSWAGVHPDIQADALRLPFPAQAATHIYCGHLLEHLDESVGLPTFLDELARIMTADGQICFVGPDYDRALAVDPDPILLATIRDGGSRWPGDRHLWLSTGAAALAHIRRRFPDAQDIPVAELDSIWPIPFRVGWQYAIVT